MLTLENVYIQFYPADLSLRSRLTIPQISLNPHPPYQSMNKFIDYRRSLRGNCLFQSSNSPALPVVK